MTESVAEKIADLTVEQAAMLDQLKHAKTQRDNARDGYYVQVGKCFRAGISYGLMSHALGVFKETLWRQERAFLKRTKRLDG